MGMAIDTVLAFSTQGAASAFPTALAAAGGDSLTVRSTVGETGALLRSFIVSAGGAQKFRIISPLLHDNVTGLTFQPGEVPAVFQIPAEAGVKLNEQDTLTVQGACGAATTITAGLVIEYENLRGTEAQLFRWADIRDDVKYYKSLEVDVNAVAVGAWTDTLITATENQLHADKSYAVLGYEVDPAIDIVGVKGAATGNLRICGPGPTSTLRISDYYIEMAERMQKPYIPVFQANDRNSFYVSCANHAAIAAQGASVYLYIAELKTKR